MPDLPGTGKAELHFHLPAELEAGEPPEARGLARDEVRLMVSYYADNGIVHTRFRQIGDYLHEGDMLVINTSGTMNAAMNALREDGTALELHLSTLLPAGLWVVEVRVPDERASHPFRDAHAGEILKLPNNATATLHVPYQSTHELETNEPGPTRLWMATLHLGSPLLSYLAQYGFPIRYSYVRHNWPGSYYQTVYATEVGSAEMPSAGRAFTTDLLVQLVARGVQVVPLLLHTGVASQEDFEPPYAEFYRVPLETARSVNAARSRNRRIIAVGTTVVRALETVTDREGIVHPGEGWTDLVVTPNRGIRAINGLLTGLHEPLATHLEMLKALTGTEHLALTYAEALREKYLWHEFGDLHLILPYR